MCAGPFGGGGGGSGGTVGSIITRRLREQQERTAAAGPAGINHILPVVTPPPAPGALMGMRLQRTKKGLSSLKLPGVRTDG